MSPDSNLVQRLERHGQRHLLAWCSSLSESQRARLTAEIAAIDFDQLDGLLESLVHGEVDAAVEPQRVHPIEVIRLPQTDGERVEAGGRGGR